MRHCIIAEDYFSSTEYTVTSEVIAHEPFPVGPSSGRLTFSPVLTISKFELAVYEYLLYALR